MIKPNIMQIFNHDMIILLKFCSFIWFFMFLVQSKKKKKKKNPKEEFISFNDVICNSLSQMRVMSCDLLWLFEKITCWN